MNFKYYYDEEDEYELEVDNYDFENGYINSDYRSYHGCKEVKTSSITFTNKFKNEFISLLKGGYNIDARIVLLLDKSPDNSLYSEPDSLVYPYFLEVYSYSFDGGHAELLDRVEKAMNEVLRKYEMDEVVFYSGRFYTSCLDKKIKHVEYYDLSLTVGFIDEDGEIILIDKNNGNIEEYVIGNYLSYLKMINQIKHLEKKWLRKLARVLQYNIHLDFENESVTPLIVLYYKSVEYIYKELICRKLIKE